MAFGSFTLTAHFDGYDDAPAIGAVTVMGKPNVVKDAAGKKFKVGPKTEVLDKLGNFTMKLPSDATTGNSTTIGFVARVDLQGQKDALVTEFYARPISEVVDLTAVTTQTIESIGDTALNASRAEAAAAAAQAAAADAIAAGAGIDVGAEGFLGKVDMQVGNPVIAMLGDSTGNAVNEWFRIAFGNLAAAHPKFRAEYYGWDDPTLEPWSTPTSGAYNPVDVVQTGVAGAVEQNTVHDTFTRTAADLYGSTPEIGAAWGGNVIAQGDWSLDGSKAVATADTSRTIVASSGGSTGDQRVVASGVTLTTSTSAANRSFYVVLKYIDGNNYILIEFRTASATGATTLWIISRVAGVARNVVSQANILTANQASVTFSIECRITGLTVAAYLNGATTPSASGDLTQAEADGLATATSAGLRSENQTGMSVSGFDLYVTNNIPAATVKAYNGSLGGTTWAQYQIPRMARLLPEAPDVVFMSSSHNHGAMSTTNYLAEVKATIDAVRALWPDVGFVLVSQNPRYSPAAFRVEHGNRMVALRKYAKSRGYGYVGVYERFLTSAADEGRSKVQADGIHPTTGTGDTGSGLWATVVTEFLSA